MSELSTELSETVKNFLTQFEFLCLPHINKGKGTSKLGGLVQPITIYVSSETLRDPQLKELLNISPGTPVGRFMGVTVKGKPDMTIETFYKEGDDGPTL